MKMLIDSSKRFRRRVSLLDEAQGEIISLESNEDLLKLIDDILKRAKISWQDLSSVRAKLEGESRVGVLIGVSATNALNYLLGLKKVGELEFPKDDDRFLA